MFRARVLASSESLVTADPVLAHGCLPVCTADNVMSAGRDLVQPLYRPHTAGSANRIAFLAGLRKYFHTLRRVLRLFPRACVRTYYDQT